MLKGILFVIAIVVTFDIGVALINSWNTQSTRPAHGVGPTEDNAEKPNKESIETNVDINQSGTEKGSSVIIDMSLPVDEAGEVDKFQDPEVSLDPSTESQINFENTIKNADKITFRAKPIVAIENKEEISLEGASVGITVKLDR